MASVFDEGLALFAGLNVTPKRSFLSEYSCRIASASYPKLMSAWFDAIGALGLERGVGFHLDFHTIPFHGEDALVEKHYVSKRSRRQKGVLAFLAQDAERRVFCYANAGVRKADQADEVLRFAEFWEQRTGRLPQELVFDSKLTTYANLETLNQMGIETSVILAGYDWSNRGEGTGGDPQGAAGSRASATGRRGRLRASQPGDRIGGATLRRRPGRPVREDRDGVAPARRPRTRAPVRVCLDSWAILAWMDGEEPALARVEEAIADRPLASWVNLVEVYYRVERDQGRDAADETLADLRAALSLDLPGTARMIDVARLKARAPIALADCFAIATAAAHDRALLTGDPEIIELSERPCRVEDLRPH
jgi:predicted nucleic acid-binding protein